jgi:predicted acylesterase/phospholipase RssA
MAAALLRGPEARVALHIAPRNPRHFASSAAAATCKVRIFECAEITADAVLASACLPLMFQAVEIDGDHYWDGGYMGNPAIFPLIYNCGSEDVVVVHINPINRPDVPTTAAPWRSSAPAPPSGLPCSGRPRPAARPRLEPAGVPARPRARNPDRSHRRAAHARLGTIELVADRTRAVTSQPVTRGRRARSQRTGATIMTGRP